MRNSGIFSKVLLLAIAALFALALAHQAAQIASAALPARSPERASAASLPEPQQFPIMDQIANKIIQKYQTSSCEQLWQEKAASKAKPKTTQEQEAIGILRTDAQMRTAFINKIAAPIVNKMFECGMVP